ncbi:hypothetical protein Hanom_Chr16g01523571 [Helianthus anomalus]
MHQSTNNYFHFKATIHQQCIYAFQNNIITNSQSTNQITGPTWRIHSSWRHSHLITIRHRRIHPHRLLPRLPVVRRHHLRNRRHRSARRRLHHDPWRLHLDRNLTLNSMVLKTRVRYLRKVSGSWQRHRPEIRMTRRSEGLNLRRWRRSYGRRLRDIEARVRV